jgi:penicillin-binding protein 1A
MKRRSRIRAFIQKHLRTPNPVMQVVYMGIGTGFLLGGLIIILIAITPAPGLDSFETRKVTQSTKIYDRTGKTILYDLNRDVRRYQIPFEDISPNIKNATLAIEDSGFYEHGGVSLTGTLRSLYVDITTHSFSQGGSTLTQQVVKKQLTHQSKK